MIQLTPNIAYRPSTREPLSAEVFFIEKNGKLYIYDVGNGEVEFPNIHKHITPINTFFIKPFFNHFFTK